METPCAATSTGFQLGEHWVCTVRLPSGTVYGAKKSLMNVVVVDNSASMGSLSRAALSIIGRGMYVASCIPSTGHERLVPIRMPAVVTQLACARRLVL